MGRPIQKTWFGTGNDMKIVVTGVKFADGTTASNAYIVKQTGSTAYIVQDSALAHAAEIVFMVNATSTGALLPGQCYINATPFGGSARPCEKISQYRLSIYEANGTIGNYSWSTIPAVARGQVDLVTDIASGAILSASITLPGFGYFAAPTVNFTGGGTGATGTTTVANGAVTGINVTAGGSGYATGTLTISAPPASVTATGTVTTDGNLVTGVSITNAGANGYYTTPPLVTFGGPGTGATGTAVLTAGRVTSVTIGNAGTGYTTATVTFAAPLAASTATGTATVNP